MMTAAICLCLAAPAFPPPGADPVRKLAMGYHNEDRRIHGAQLTIKVTAEARAADTGGGYMLHVDYAIDYTGRRKPFIIFPPSLTAWDHFSTRLFAYISDGKGGVSKVGVVSHGYGPAPESPRNYTEADFLVSKNDQPVTGRLSVIYSGQEPSREHKLHPRFRTQDFRPGEMVYFMLGYRARERGDNLDAWEMAAYPDGGYPLKSNVTSLLIGD